ncbi:alpha/beta fold hydrolase [Marinicrinis sediminis]|uniref:Alpha/beta fold hydrolase n=1 Tax=Marinicrinis sediminis TaxID=1652465 RepID=A0ABW5RDF9_9BACL
MLNRKQINTGHHTLSIADVGEGPAIVLLHGFCGSADYWEPVVNRLSSSYRCIVPDLHGHGQSPAPASPYTLEAIAHDVYHILDQLDIHRFIVLGHSLGGYATLAFAEAHQEGLAGMGLIHSTPLPDTDEAKQNRLNGVENIRRDGIRSFVDQLVPKLFAPEHVKTLSDQVAHVKGIGYETSAEGATGMLHAMRARPDRQTVLSASSVPVLLVAGADDQVIPPEKTHVVQGDPIQSHTLANCGHMGMFEAQEELTAHIKQFADHCFK